MNDAFIAFWTGMCGGIVLGIFLCAVAIAVQNHIEGGRQDENDRR
jgi:hypothetical protein